MLSNNAFSARVIICGLVFDCHDMASTISYVVGRLREKKLDRFLLSTPNLNYLIASQTDSSFRRSVTLSDFSIPDGFPIVLISKIMGLPLRERVAGSTLFDILRSKDTGLGRPWRVYFLGGQAGIAEQAAKVLNDHGQHMICVGFHEAGFGSVEEMSDPALIDEINRSGADFLVVAIGAKKGQAWIVRNLESLSLPMVSYLGAVINFVAGNVRRAPLFWQRLGLEWLWRIKEEPSLWRRYWSDGVALCRLMVTQILPSAINERWKRPDIAAFDLATVEVADNGYVRSVRLLGAWGKQNRSRLQSALNTVEKGCCIDLAETTYLDSFALGELVTLEGRLERKGLVFKVSALSSTLRKTIEGYGLAHWIQRTNNI